MSYILKALEKLEENHPTAGPPGRQKEPGPTAAKTRRLGFLPYLIAAALLINTGVFLWWLHPWEKTKSAVVAPGTPLPQAASTPAVDGPQPAEEKTFSRGKEYNQTPAGNTSEKRENSMSDTGPAPADTGTGSAGPAREAHKVYNLNDLPPSVRKDVPDIAISGHSYSTDPSLRIVLINGSTMREGQVVTGGLRLEQITADGVILSYQGYRLRKGVF